MNYLIFLIFIAYIAYILYEAFRPEFRISKYSKDSYRIERYIKGRWDTYHVYIEDPIVHLSCGDAYCSVVAKRNAYFPHFVDADLALKRHRAWMKQIKNTNKEYKKMVRESRKYYR